LHQRHAELVTAVVRVLIADDRNDVARDVLLEVLLGGLEAVGGAAELVEAVTPVVVVLAVLALRELLSAVDRLSAVAGEVGGGRRVAVDVADVGVAPGGRLGYNGVADVELCAAGTCLRP
jgi:hypothetical protein